MTKKINKRIYNEIEYWSKREMPTSCSDDYTKNHLRFLSNNLVSVKKLLDVGPGIGRTFQAYSNVEIVEGYDISTNYESRVLEESRKYKFKFNLKIGTSISSLPYENNEFDSAIASEVLLHQRPENIIKIMSELDRVSKKVIIITYMEPNIPFQKINEFKYRKKLHCFNYNYLEICKDNKWNIFDFQYYKKQVFFVYSSKEKGN